MSIADDVLAVATSLNCSARLMNSDEVGRIHGDMWKKFTPLKMASSPLWENVVGEISVQDSEAWRWIGEYVEGRGLIMLIDDHFGKITGVYLDDGNWIIKLLEECDLFVFYLTDVSLRFLLCYNDHDFLIAVGDAGKWLNERLARR